MLHPHQSTSCWIQLRSRMFGSQGNMRILTDINFASSLTLWMRIRGTSTTTCRYTSSRGMSHPRKKVSDGQWKTCTCSMPTSIAARCELNHLLLLMKCAWMPKCWSTMPQAIKWGPLPLQNWRPIARLTGTGDGASPNFVGPPPGVWARCQRRLMKLKLIQRDKHRCLLKFLFLSSKKSSTSLIEVTWILFWSFRKESLAISCLSRQQWCVCVCFFLGFWCQLVPCSFNSIKFEVSAFECKSWSRGWGLSRKSAEEWDFEACKAFKRWSEGAWFEWSVTSRQAAFIWQFDC